MKIEANYYFCILQAQVAELVDALVSNTSGANRAGSIPALGTKQYEIYYLLSLYIIYEREKTRKI